jgi:manganese/zinc/iron transport system permease protein
MAEFFVQPWTWGEWMWRGMLGAGLMGVTAAILGVFLYFRRMSLLADAISHVALLGIVVGYLIAGTLDPLVMVISATASGLFAAICIGGLSKHPKVRSDAAMGIVFTGLFALGVVLLSTSVEDVHLDTNHALLGDVLGISDRSLILLALSAGATVTLVFIFRRWLTVSSFDPIHAAAIGIPVTVIHYTLISLVSVAAVAGFEAVGAILVIAMFVTPAATAHRIADTFPGMLGIAVSHSLLSTIVGMYAAIWLEVNPGGCIVVTGALLYAATLAATSLIRHRRAAEPAGHHA